MHVALLTHSNAAWLKAIHTRIVLVDDGLDELDKHIAQLVLPEGVDGLRQNQATERRTGLGRASRSCALPAAVKSLLQTERTSQGKRTH